MKTRLFVVASAIASALAMAGCKQEAKAPEPIRPVLSAVLQPTASDSTVAAGTVQPRYETSLGLRVLGRLIARPVNVGDLVTEGQTVAAIDPTALELAVRSAKADLSKAQALLENAVGTEDRKRILIRTDATTQQTLITASLTDGHSSVLRVPASAVLKQGAETLVWVIDAPTSTVSLHKVDLSEDEGGIRVTGGLSIGARIVTAGIHSLKQGQQVRIEQDATP